MQLQPAEPELRAEAPIAGASFEALFREHFGFVYRNLCRLGVPPAAVEDAVQEVFLVVLRRPDAPITSVRGWLYGIARRIAWRQRRSAGRQHRLAQALADEAPRALDGAVAVAEREAAALLERFLGRLDEDKRAVFLLAELEQMTAPEIARALEVKENTVYSRLRAARQEFDRTFARVRLRERRSSGEAALDERALLLSRARRAGEPNPATRQRVLLALIAGAGLTGAGEAAAASAGASPAHASAWTAVPGQQLAAWSGTTAGGHALGVAVVGIVGAVLVAARPAPDDAPARTAAVEAKAGANDVPAAARPPAPAPASPTPPEPVAPVDESSVPFARLASAAARASRSTLDVFAIGAPAATHIHVPKAMSSGTSYESPPATVDLDALRRESSLMAEARAALGAGAWTQAHELLQRHALEFPAGALVEERRLSLVTALCSLGQLQAARAEIARIAGEHPDSPAARKARGLCPAAAG
ncbi:sigma-70 family RNA polymerase sigma factor [Nannocystis pusilla]|uniref:Sigma-70 family RNA polymerase sigma factor n=1 Tax=Nannocystis pusilla TaxID=889268 RepID=A0A9X3EKK0_9BACT|nr:sigma-70 family RNA polymerase sigma factor [Nannocystis pusilla]MCY1005794.1 sigma-70 family RNA polymerase sigma factor [Nannocystis pusilla]